MNLTTAFAVGGLVVLCGFFAWIIARYGILFYREATGARKLSTLAGAAAVIAIIVNTIVGTFTQPLPVLKPRAGSPFTVPAPQLPVKPASPQEGQREPPAAKP